jgi:hypothetical protein
MAKLTLEEKRLQQIRMQLFGKERQIQTKGKASSYKQINIGEVSKTPTTSPSTINPNNLGEARFLKQDITKVIVLSSIALGGQFLLYFLSLQGVINLNMFHLF